MNSLPEEWPTWIRRHPRIVLLGCFPPVWLVGLVICWIGLLKENRESGWISLPNWLVVIPMVMSIFWPFMAYSTLKEE